jgi:hypothetical protein
MTPVFTGVIFKTIFLDNNPDSYNTIMICIVNYQET